ncbi:MAG: hypothetical protein ACR2NN_04890 [Bryobacteraceae bacterium]
MSREIGSDLNPDHPWPDKPEIPDLLVEIDPAEFLSPDDAEFAWAHQDQFQHPSNADIDEQNVRMLGRQCLFRWAAQSIAVAMSGLGDLDLAVWTSDLGKLQALKKALHRGLAFVQDTPYGGPAHHQVDVHVLEYPTGAYRGRLCFGQCPKPGKRECLTPGCGAQPFLRQFERYRFNARRCEAEPKVTLFDRPSGFLVRHPRMDAKPARIVYLSGSPDQDENPF